MHIAVSNESILLVIKFRIGGSLRFLSHAETLKVFQRACARAGIQIQHTRGFNPHPKLSLPLPRPVGVESDDELLCLRCSMLDTRRSIPDAQSGLCTSIKAKLSEQLPEGIELLSVSIAESKQSFQPCSATYILKVRPEYLNSALQSRIERFLASKILFVKRQLGRKDSQFKILNSKFKNVDVRPFLKSIELDNNIIIVQCAISPFGSIRVDEILELLEIETDMLAAPIKRTNVQWHSN